jgi:Ni,Fe-hydrogenase III component G
MDVEQLLQNLDPAGGVERDAGGGYWARWPGLDVRAMATAMRALEARLATITAAPEAEGAPGYRLIYHWDGGDCLVNLATTIASGTVPSIADIIPCADWAEREIRDYYGLEFAGRTDTPPLMLRAGDPVGVFARTGDLGRDTDPARTARAAADSETAPTPEGSPR